MAKGTSGGKATSGVKGTTPAKILPVKPPKK